jgi:tetratricopeptide (TPR) repeat protein
MSKNISLGLAVLAVAVLSSCSKMGPLSADYFTVTPNPLEANAGKVPVTINGLFPEKYMKRKAVVTVTPVLRYQGGEALGQSATFQGEKVIGNNQTISYRVGGNYTMKTTYDYIDPMLKSELYLAFTATVGKKTVSIPEVKVADGVLATSELAKRTIKSASTSYAPDNFQRTIQKKQEANIQFLINQAKIRTGEINSVSVQDFIATLKDIPTEDSRKSLDGIEISSYASPDGALDFNTKLADQRGKATKSYVEGEMKGAGVTGNVDSKYTAEDWEGFQQLVSQSNIQDKEVIVRVLSMYSDPEEREKQIRNISAAYGDLAKEILPRLRRSRIMLRYNLIGRTDDEIMAQYSQDPTKLSSEEVLYAANLAYDEDQQEAILNKMVELYPNDYRGYNNLATLAYQQGDYAKAKQLVNKALAINPNAPEANVNSALLSMGEGKTAEATQALAKGSNALGLNEAMGNLYLLQGNYSQAVKSFGNDASNSAALAQMLNKDYLKAATTLNGVAVPDAMTSYIKALIAARTNNNDLAIDNLKTAISLDSSLADYAAKDLEFAKLRNNEAFTKVTQQK